MEFGNCALEQCHNDHDTGTRCEKKRTKIPCTIVTGFLGAGKTTLLNHILHSPDHGLKIAVIENEYGEVGVDDALLEIETEEEIFEMNNGCICCTVRGDLIRILTTLIDRYNEEDAEEEGGTAFDHIIIETTGLADPAPVAQTFFIGDATIQDHYVLDAILTVVDAKHVLPHLHETKPDGVENETIEQIAFADKIILNKLDLLDPATADHDKAILIKEIRKINTSVEILETTYGKLEPISNILNIRAFDLASVLEKEGDAFLSEDGQDHEHDASIGSVGIVFDGALQLHKLNTWLTILLRDHGVDIFRSKGILNIADSEARYVFQGVHMLLTISSSDDNTTTNGQPDTTTTIRPWKPNEARTNRLIFIGRNLNREVLTSKFKECLV